MLSCETRKTSPAWDDSRDWWQFKVYVSFFFLLVSCVFLLFWKPPKNIQCLQHPSNFHIKFPRKWGELSSEIKTSEDLVAVKWPWGSSGGTSGNETVCPCRRHKRHGFDPWVRKIPWRRAWQLTPVFLLGESHGQRSLEGYSPGLQRVRHDWNELACTQAQLVSCSVLLEQTIVFFLDKDLSPVPGKCELMRQLSQSYGKKEQNIHPKPQSFWRDE